MRYLAALFPALIAGALIPFALELRSPFFSAVRSWALSGVIVMSLALIFAEIFALRTSRPDQRLLRVISAVGLGAAAIALTGALALEARYYWIRHKVLHADPVKLEELGRHLIVGYRSLSEVGKLVELGAVAGVFISGANARGKDVARIRQDIGSLQDLRKKHGLTPLWIATDQEGGVVSRLSPPLTHLPALSEIVKHFSGADRLENAVRDYGSTHGRELAGIGVNLNFAPVVDLNHNIVDPNDRFTRIFLRAISDDPAIVSHVADLYCAALAESGVRCVLKHFPGLGRVREDTHWTHASLDATVAELSATDWAPFRAFANRTGPFTMLSHARLTALDGELPVSFSKPVVTGLLRGEWKHEGVLITDDFCMSAVYRSPAGIDNGSIEALNAGVDLILVSWDPDQYYRIMYALLEADREGKLDRDALRRSAKRLEQAAEFIRRRPTVAP